MKPEDFKDLISVDDYKMCESKMEKNPTWYPLILDVFVKFLYKVICLFALVCFIHRVLCNYPYTHLSLFQKEISNSADTAARLYRESTPEVLRTAPGIWDTMTKAHDRLIKNIRSRNFEKFIFVAHKDNGEDFFQDVPPALQFFFDSTFTSTLASCIFSYFTNFFFADWLSLFYPPCPGYDYWRTPKGYNHTHKCII